MMIAPKKMTSFLCLYLFSTALLANSGQILSTSFEFMSQQLTIQYDPAMIVKEDICLKKKCFKNFFNRMKKTPYQTFSEGLDQHRKDLQLNDWLFYKLVNTAVTEIIGKKDRLHQGFTTWFLLNQAGYDARISVTKGGDPFIYTFTNEEMGNIPSFLDGEKTFVNLTSIDLGFDTRTVELFKSDFIANEKGKGFVFTLSEVPALTSKVVDKKVTFTCHDETHTLDLKVDAGVVEMLKTYPEMSDLGYVTATLSPALKESLYPQLEKMIEGKSKVEALEILVSFTRSAFTYKSDWSVYDQDKPMFAEQLFFNDYSDHEDRCALFYNLVKDLLDLPMLVLTHYNNNMTIGVELDAEADRKFFNKGRSYLICDPTVPSTSSEVGAYPNGLTEMTAKVLGRYK